jgi:hypothetical protein
MMSNTRGWVSGEWKLNYKMERLITITLAIQRLWKDAGPLSSRNQEIVCRRSTESRLHVVLTSL